MQQGLERWKGRVALVTGATSGIGEACAHALANAGMRVAVAGRRAERLEALKQSLAPAEVLAVPTDMRSEEAIQRMFATVGETWGPVDVLVNNAGLGYKGNLGDAPTEDWREVLDVNVLALSICTREALRGMAERDGAIVNISSIAGQRVPAYRGVAFYSASKHAVTAFTEGLRQEIVERRLNVKAVTISPGMVSTEFHQKAGREAGAASFYGEYKVLEPQDIADAMLYVLSTPPHVQVNDVTIRPIHQPH